MDRGRIGQTLSAGLAAAVLAGTLHAQGGDGRPVARYPSRESAVRHGPAPARHAPRPGLSRLCGIDVTARPARVQPGGRGEFLVTMTARPGYAVDEDAMLEICAEDVSAAVTLGATSRHARGPSDAGTPADWIVLSVPFTVAANTGLGPVQIALDVAAAVVEPGVRPLGLLRDRVVARLDIVSTTPGRRAGAMPAETDAAHGAAAAHDDAAPTLGEPAGSQPSQTPETVTPIGDLDAAPSTHGDATRGSDLDPLSILLSWTGAGLGILLLSVALRRVLTSRS